MYELRNLFFRILTWYLEIIYIYIIMLYYLTLFACKLHKYYFFTFFFDYKIATVNQQYAHNCQESPYLKLKILRYLEFKNSILFKGKKKSCFFLRKGQRLTKRWPFLLMIIWFINLRIKTIIYRINNIMPKSFNVYLKIFFLYSSFLILYWLMKWMIFISNEDIKIYIEEK